MLVTAQILAALHPRLASTWGLCRALWAWKSGLGSLSGHLISSDPGDEMGGGAVTPHNQGPGWERKPQGKEGLAWLSHIRRGQKGAPSLVPGRGGRASWDQLPEAIDQQTRAGSVLSCGRGRGLGLSWALGLRSGSAAPEIPFLPDSEAPRVQPGWAGAAPASSRPVQHPRLHGASELRVLRMGLGAWELGRMLTVRPSGWLRSVEGRQGRPHHPHTHTGCCHGPAAPYLPPQGHGPSAREPLPPGVGGQAAASSSIFQVRTQVHRGKGLVGGHTAGEQQSR